jgi:hypothetical protein
MREVAENYVALHDPNDPVWSNLDPKDRLRIESISYIGATQLHPLILSAIEKFSKHDLQRLLHLIEVVAVRYQLVARGRPGRMESLGSQAARKIFAGEITSATQVRIELSEIYPTDETFRQDFLQTVQKDKVVARYMLRMLEQQGRKARSGGLKDVGPEADLTLEHIMPRTLTPKWRDYLGSDAERHAEYRNRIGNLCLLGKANKKLGNSLFTEKVGEYSKSGNQTTSSLKEFSEWRCAQIDDRQAKLADFAVQAWRFN